MIVVSISGCDVYLLSGKDENVQYIPEGIKDMPKERLAEIRIEGTLMNRPIVSIDDTLVKYPGRGSIVGALTFGFAGCNLSIRVTEGKHIFRRMYLHKGIYRKGQYVTVGARHGYDSDLFSRRHYVVTKPGIVPSRLVGEYYEQWKPEIGSFHVKKGEKILWNHIKKDVIETVDPDEEWSTVDQNTEAEFEETDDTSTDLSPRDTQPVDTDQYLSARERSQEINDKPKDLDLEGAETIDYGSLNHRLKLKLKGNEWVEDACFSPTGQLIASTDKRQVRLWDSATGTSSRILKSNSTKLKAVCFSGDGKLIASGDEWAKIIKIWDLSSGKCLRTIDTEHRKDLFDVSFSANGRFIVSASDDKTLKLWDVESGSLVRTYKGHSAGVFCVAFSPDGKCIASGSWDKTLRLWDVESGGQLKILKGHTSTIESLAFSPNGDHIAACESGGNKIIVWDVEGATQVVEKKLLGALCLAFAPDGHHVVSGDAYGQVHVLNVKNGEWVKTFKSHKGILGVAHINAVGFSPNGKCVLAAADDKYVHVFQFE
jgi:WD40 repeat protein